MRRQPVRFFSDRHLLDGDLWLPDDHRDGERLPAVISCSGYQGLKTIHPERFARTLVPAGYAALSFDYRGFGASEGERGRLVPQEWVEDVRSAVSYMSTRPEVDADRMALLGWGLGGGVAIAEAADDPRVRAVATCNAIADGERSTRFMHADQEWKELVAKVDEDRRRKVVTGRSQIVHPFDIVRLDDVTGVYVEDELTKAAGFGSGVTLESADYLFRFRPADVVHRIAPRPLFLAHGERNELHSPDESRELHRLAGDNAQLLLLEGMGHTEWMFDEHPTYQLLLEHWASFLGDALDGGSTVTRP